MRAEDESKEGLRPEEPSSFEPAPATHGDTSDATGAPGVARRSAPAQKPEVALAGAPARAGGVEPPARGLRSLQLGPLIALGGLLLLLAVVAQALLGLTAGPEEELLTQLKRTERDGLQLRLPVTGGTLVSSRHLYQRITITPDLQARTARAVSTLDFDGKLGTTKVSSLGLERVGFVYSDGQWRPADGFAPELSRIVDTLERRRRALENADAEALRPLLRDSRVGAAPTTGAEPPTRAHATVASLRPLQDRRYIARAWYIRNERDEVLVTEEYRLQGTLPDRPVDEKGRVSLRLGRDERGYFFSGSLR